MNLFGPPWRWFLKLKPSLGKNTRDLGRTNPTHDIVNYIKPVKGAVFSLVTYNFPSAEWERGEWLDWLRELKTRGVKVRILGGQPKNPKPLRALVQEGILEARITDKPSTQHIGLSSEPRQVWFEGYHKSSHNAYSTFYTDSPSDETWERLSTSFEKAWQDSDPVTA